MPRFDVFVSYNNHDFDQARALATELRDLGLSVWFDRWELAPGKTWVDELHRALEDSHTVLVLIGPAGPGPVQRAEVRDALSRQFTRGMPVIPVILPGVAEPELPSFLPQDTWIDCREQQTSHEQLSRLVWGITGRRPRTVIGQFGDSFELDIVHPDWLRRTITVSTLPNNTPDQLLDLTWETFGEGIELLAQQMRSYGTRLPVDACIGVNEAGLVMATFFASHLFGRSAIAYFRCAKRGNHVYATEGSFFPELEPEPVLLVCDFEVKQAAVLSDLARTLRERYARPQIYFAVFGALVGGQKLAIDSVDELAAAPFLKSTRLRDVFIAATMLRPGIEPPLGLR